jgi:thymidine phosphorylase
MIVQSLQNGTAAKRFERMCIGQGTPEKIAQNLLSAPEKVVPKASHQTELYARSEGYVKSIDAMVLAEVAREHGAGRFSLEDLIDPAVGFVLKTSKGKEIRTQSAWIVVHHNQPLTEKQRDALQASLHLSEEPVRPVQRLIKVIQ